MSQYDPAQGDRPVPRPPLIPGFGPDPAEEPPAEPAQPWPGRIAPVEWEPEVAAAAGPGSQPWPDDAWAQDPGAPDLSVDSQGGEHEDAEAVADEEAPRPGAGGEGGHAAERADDPADEAARVGDHAPAAEPLDATLSLPGLGAGPGEGAGDAGVATATAREGATPIDAGDSAEGPGADGPAEPPASAPVAEARAAGGDLSDGGATGVDLSLAGAAGAPAAMLTAAGAAGPVSAAGTQRGGGPPDAGGGGPARPKAGRDPVGTIPYVAQTRSWGRRQLANWRVNVLRFLCAGLAVVLAVALTPGVRFTGWRAGDFVQIAVIFGLLNMLLKPLLQFLSLRFIFSTYGLVVVLINALLLVILAVLLPGRFATDRPLSVLLASLLVGVVGLLLETLLGVSNPILDRDYRERNGLG